MWDCYEGYDAQNFKVHDSRIELVGKGEFWHPLRSNLLYDGQVFRSYSVLSTVALS